MASTSVAGRVAYDAFGVRPQTYEHLIAMASRYARRHFDGRTVINRQTHLPIELDWRAGLAKVFAPGVAPEALLAVPLLMAAIARAQYVRILPDVQRRSNARKLLLFTSMIEIARRRVGLSLVIRENQRGKYYLERVVSYDARLNGRQDGGATSDTPVGLAPDAGSPASQDAPTDPSPPEAGGRNPPSSALGSNAQESSLPVVQLPSGEPVLDPNTNQPIVRPRGVSVSDNVATGQQLLSDYLEAMRSLDMTNEQTQSDGISNAELQRAWKMYDLFARGRPMDYQRVNGSFNDIFTPFSSYNFGAVARAAGYSLDQTLRAAGLYNLTSTGDKSGQYFNNPKNVPLITLGWQQQPQFVPQH